MPAAIRLRAPAAVVALLVASCFGAFIETPRAAQLEDGLYARIRTNRGVIVARLEAQRAPLAVASFVGLAEGTIDNEAYERGVPYYDGSLFHRVVEGHVIQAGAPDPERSEARGPGFRYPNEIHADLSHDHAGALGVANGGPHTNGAQFYVTLGDRSYLDGTYIVFGEVVDGMDVVRSIVQGDVIESVRIVRQGAEAETYTIDTETFDEMVATAAARVDRVRVEKGLREREWVRDNIGNDRLSYDSGLRVSRRRRGDGEPVETGDRIRVRYTGTAVVYRGHMLGYSGPLFDEVRFAGASEDGSPQFEDLDAQPFEYEVGSVSLNPGFERAVQTMRRGGEALFVVPFEAGGYAGGYYGPDRPGRPRFVIPPETLLIYAIEVLDDRDGLRGW